MNVKLLSRVFCCCLSVAWVPFHAAADVTNLTAAADTFINAGSPANNAGANQWFDAGTDGNGNVRRGLVRFDLTAIPPGSVVTSASLQLTVIKVPSFGPVDSTDDLYRLNTAWTEGGQIGSSGGPAAPGEATWNSRMSAMQSWTAPGALNDTAPTPSASTLVSSEGSYGWAGAGVTADVQYWVTNPPLNFGWLLVSEIEATARTVRGFAARENGTSMGVLTVTYTPPAGPSPAVFTSLTLSNKFPSPPLTTATVPVLTNGLAMLRWRGDANDRFDLLSAYTLGPGAAWTMLQPNIEGSATGSNFLSDPPYAASPANPAAPAAYYRLNSLAPKPPGLALRLQVVAANLVSPVALTYAHDGSRRMFVADQPGQIWLIDSTGSLLSTPFLDISNRMVTLRTNYDERGLLGLAFHPGYATNGRFFVYYTAPSANTNYDDETRISEFKVSTANTNLADPASERVLLSIPQPQSNHKGSALAFGPDGYLYCGPGDGGSEGDPHGVYGNGQVLTNLLAKMLRLDVDSATPYAIPSDNPFVGVPGALPEIYAYGLRNPFRFSFDRGGTHQCFIGDVGQNIYEEVDILRKGGNFGWRIMEGNHIFDPTIAGPLGVNVAALDAPIFEYQHGPLGISVIGGFVYRGAAFPELAGNYVFGDFSTSFGTPDGQLYYLVQNRPGIWERFSFQLWPNGGRFGRFVKGFGEDEAGELYVLSTTKLGPNSNTGDVRHLVRP